MYGTTSREREAFALENRKLKELLAAHGIAHDLTTPTTTYSGMPGSFDGSTSESASSGFPHDSNSTGPSPSPMSGQRLNSPGTLQSGSLAQLPSNRVDYDQVGIDFVLAYDSYGRPMRPAYPSPPPNE